MSKTILVPLTEEEIINLQGTVFMTLEENDSKENKEWVNNIYNKFDDCLEGKEGFNEHQMEILASNPTMLKDNYQLEWIEQRDKLTRYLKGDTEKRG